MQNRFLSIIAESQQPKASLIRPAIPTRKKLLTPSKANGYATSASLEWEGATANQLAFMEKVFAIHKKRSSARRKYVGNLPSTELAVVEGSKKLQKDAAAAFKKLLLAARGDIAKDQAKVIIGVGSAYRSASEQRRIWQQNFSTYYTDTAKHRATLSGGKHGGAAAKYLAGYVGRRVASPGYSNHQDGLAVDIRNTENGRRVRNSTKAGAIKKWKASWLWKWLEQNAATYHFYQDPDINEPWHWVYKPAVSTASGLSSGSIEQTARLLLQQFSNSQIQELIKRLSGLAVQQSDGGTTLVTVAQLEKIFPNGVKSALTTLADAINNKGDKFGIDDTPAVAHFLSQAGHEVGGFSKGLSIAENFNYSVDRLIEIFGKYFYKGTPKAGKKNAEDYGRKTGQAAKKQAIANIVYANRLGNGNSASGDGYKYRGRGIFQLTGKSNYESFNTYMQANLANSPDFVANPDKILEDKYAILSAMWYFKNRVVDKLTMDTATVEQVTKKVNGGLHGLSGRTSIYNDAVKILK